MREVNKAARWTKGAEFPPTPPPGHFPCYWRCVCGGFGGIFRKRERGAVLMTRLWVVFDVRRQSSWLATVRKLKELTSWKQMSECREKSFKDIVFFAVCWREEFCLGSTDEALSIREPKSKVDNWNNNLSNSPLYSQSFLFWERKWKLKFRGTEGVVSLWKTWPRRKTAHRASGEVRQEAGSRFEVSMIRYFLLLIDVCDFASLPTKGMIFPLWKKIHEIIFTYSVWYNG